MDDSYLPALLSSAEESIAFIGLEVHLLRQFGSARARFEKAVEKVVLNERIIASTPTENLISPQQCNSRTLGR